MQLQERFGWTEKFIMFGITGAKSWQYFNWSKENVGSAFQAPSERVSEGPIKQERNKILRKYGESK
jgi:hypothetical protein